MENYDLYYSQPLNAEPAPVKVSIYQAVKAMIFGLVALSVAEIPFLGFFVAPIFAIISLCMGKDFKIKHPGQANGFLKAAKITSIISFPMCAVSTILCLIEAFSSVTGSYYYY